jgi:16S rRNA (guanine527-N7)-methyltransferase
MLKNAMPLNDRFQTYHDLLLEWQKSINLISPATIDTAWERHFEDSIQLADFIPDTTKIICDIGSGAGFPALVLAMKRPDIQFHLIESDTRKCAFLQTVSRETQCDNVIIHNDRIENVIDDIQADLVTARALASLKSLIDYCYPTHRDFLLLKGKNWQDEVKDAQKKYQFDLADHASKTDPEARILIVGKIAKI